MFNNKDNIFEEINFFQTTFEETKARNELMNELLANPFINFELDERVCFDKPKWNSYPDDMIHNEVWWELAEVDKRSSATAIDQSAQKNKLHNGNKSNAAAPKEDASAHHNRKHIESTRNYKNTEVTKECDIDCQAFDSFNLNFNDIGELRTLINNPYTDLNVFVSEILTAGPTDPEIKRKRTVNKDLVVVRIRKTKSQIDALINAYESNPNWEQEEINLISAELGLSEKQVYKWYWDYKTKAGEQKPRGW